MRFEFNEGAMQKIQDEVNAELRRIIWEVRNEMVGQPAAEVHGELTRRLVAGIPGVQPDEAEMRRIAEAIEADDLVE